MPDSPIHERVNALLGERNRGREVGVLAQDKRNQLDADGISRGQPNQGGARNRSRFGALKGRNVAHILKQLKLLRNRRQSRQRLRGQGQLRQSQPHGEPAGFGAQRHDDRAAKLLRRDDLRP